jgi:hypothetical protein
MSMADFEAPHTKPIAYFNIAPSAAFAESNVTTLSQPLERYQSHSSVFIRKVRPKYIIENMRLYRIHRERECSKTFRARSIVKGGSVYYEA